jgi:hypothetical protein
MKYTVLVDDNLHYMDGHESWKLGEFEAVEEAVAKAKEIVDEFLSHAYRKGMTAQQLYEQYIFFGEDPYIVGGSPKSTFSAWSYAKKKCQEICTKGQP